MNFQRPSWFEVFVATGAVPLVFGSFYRKFAEKMHLTGEEKVFELGAGSGNLSGYLARELLAGKGKLTCFDRSAAWLNIARKRLRKYPNIVFALGDIIAEDIGAEAYDVAAVHFVLHDIPAGSRGHAAEKLAAALRNEGRLFVREPIKEGRGMPPAEICALLENAGLKEMDFDIEKLPVFGASYCAIFEKRQAT